MTKSMSKRGLLKIFLAASVAAISLLWFGYVHAQPAASNPLQGLREFLGAAIAAQERHTDNLLTFPDVVGTAVGLTAGGHGAIKVYSKSGAMMGLPRLLSGIPVEVEMTGEFRAYPQGTKVAPTRAPGGSTINPQAKFTRPVPIGVSTGNEGECSAGTIGARVTDSAGNVYALSNNHVYALENSAAIGSSVLQPGRYDTNCAINPNNIIGNLSSFISMDFSSSASNTVDAAIASTTAAMLGNTTPSNGYGMPKTATVTAWVGQPVQKYGRTTSLTKGQVTGVNAVVQVGYSSGTARFINQIIVGGKKPFIKSGDSGSLLVTDPSANPVGLLFAGTSSGIAIANPIGAVLSAFGVAIDGN
jgi:hypothetical protein